ncbi:hypothetical protein I2483_13805 [Sporosarcina sp. E16_3]|uniref:hypothetical protein n=1 Tax=Sporosarcina sp. E16_3 TaxID=2789293 RepID=UPI001A939B5A|nr:hypothetical protein [Sporosarcina sp. E16_3]MBO0602738.1 hypothetical protein [Sporosarcina sp. E16_3]
MLVDAKKCPECGQVRQMYMFIMRGIKSGECIEECLDCRYDSRKKGRRPKTTKDEQVVFIDGEAYKKCYLCFEYKHTSDYVKEKTRVLGVENRCKVCKRKNHYCREKNVAYYRANKERLDEASRKWKAGNRERYLDTISAKESRRRANANKSVSTLSPDSHFLIRRNFNDVCPLTGSASTHIDHFIPVSWGLGGSDNTNLIPLDRRLNALKGNKNPFIWAEAMLAEGEFEKDAWEALVSRLAKMNDLTLEDYRDFVFMCEPT